MVAALVGTAVAGGAHFAVSDQTGGLVLGGTAAFLVAVLVAASWILALAVNGAYAVRYAATGTEEYRRLTRGAVAFVALVGCAVYLAEAPVPRTVVVVGAPLMLALSGVGRWCLHVTVARRRLAGECLQDTLLVGDVDSVLDMVAYVGSRPESSGMRIVGACVTEMTDRDAARMAEAGVRVLGSQHDTLDVVERYRVEAVAVASNPGLRGLPLRRLGWALEQQDVDLLVSPGLVDVAGPRLTMRPAAGVPMIHIERPVSSGLRYGLKLVTDRLGAFVLLLLAAPVLVVTALLVRWDSPGPALFTQRRIGEGGRSFRMVKFRTMVVDAEVRLQELVRVEHDGNETLFKLRRDPRVTRVGALLRRFSLDELPQLFNVLLGQMSLIGPRPPLPTEVELYESDALRRLRVRPGMTGLWQVSGRSDLSWGDTVRLDLWYVDNWSLALDGQIILRTAQAVLRGRGAY